MKKVLYVTNITRNINSFFIPHINKLIEEGYKVDCACKIKGEHKVNIEKFKGNVKLYDIPVTRKVFAINNIKFLYKLYKIQKKEKYDFIHVHSPIAGMYTRLLKLAFKDVTMIYTAHGFHFHNKSSKLSWYIFYNAEKLLAKLTDKLVTINNEDYQVAKKFKCKQLYKIDGVGVDFKEFKEFKEKERIDIRKEIGVDKDELLFIMVGEHNKNKNQIQLIKAMKDLENLKIKAIIIGDGIDFEKNKEYIKANSIKNVKILGFKNNVNKYINASDVLVSMSYREGLPKNVIEGLACKKIILATDVRGNNDLVEEGKNGMLVKCDDLIDTKKKIKLIYEIDYRKREKMREKSYEIAQKYDVNRILNQLIEIYK